MPEQHGKDPGYAENQREAQEAPFPAEKIDVCAAKEFHFINL
jgi:hypothetical protein